MSRLKLWFRPDRLKYITKARAKIPSPCIFCRASKKGVCLESLLLYADASSLVFINKYPYNSGHLLVLPKNHESDLLKLSQKDYISLQETIKTTATILQKAFNPEAMNIGINLGYHAGAGLPDHLHYHIIPRWSGDTNFLPVIAETKVISMSIEHVYNQLHPHFSKIQQPCS